MSSPNGLKVLAHLSRALTCMFVACLDEMMRETPDVARRRSEIQEMRTLLQKALEIVNEVRDFNSFVPGGK